MYPSILSKVYDRFSRNVSQKNVHFNKLYMISLKLFKKIATKGIFLQFFAIFWSKIHFSPINYIFVVKFL